MNTVSPFKMVRDNDMSPEERAIAAEKATKARTAFNNKYPKTRAPNLSDLAIPAVVIKGLAENKVSLGAPLCPCRFTTIRGGGSQVSTVPVCQCERHECHCMLFPQGR
jgi:ferredoxin-thioredoxin reductase catalytic subunit